MDPINSNQSEPKTPKKRQARKVDPAVKAEKPKKEATKEVRIQPMPEPKPKNKVFKSTKTKNSGRSGVGTRTYG